MLFHTKKIDWFAGPWLILSVTPEAESPAVALHWSMGTAMIRAFDTNE